MRKIRGRDKGVILEIVLALEQNWISYLLVFFLGVLGILVGTFIGKIANSYIILLIVVFLGLIIGGLFTAWAINQRDQVMGRYILQESLKQQYNAFALLIGELEHNFTVEEASLTTDKAWQNLKYEWAFFPAHLYEEVDQVYRKINELKEADIGDYRLALLERLELPKLITRLKEWQQRLKRQLPYF